MPAQNGNTANKSGNSAPEASWADAWNSMMLLLEEQTTHMKALEDIFWTIAQALPKNTPMPVKDGIKAAREIFGSIKSTGAALQCSREKFRGELQTERNIVKPKRRLRIIAPNNEEGKKRAASATPEKRSEKRKKKEAAALVSRQTKPSYCEVAAQTKLADGGDFKTVTNKKKENRKKKAAVEGQRAAKVKIPTPQPTEAIRVSAKNDCSYVDILTAMEKEVDPSKLGARVVQVRRSLKKELLIIVKRGGETSKFATALSETLKDKAEVRTLAKWKSVEIRGLAESATDTAVMLAIKGALENTELEVSCHLLTRPDGTKLAIVRLPETYAYRLMELKVIQIGWIQGRVKEHIEVPRCFKCSAFGHTSNACKGPDRSNLCRRCGGKEHLAKDCKAETLCLTCVDSGKADTAHAPRSGKCPVYRELLKGLRTQK